MCNLMRGNWKPWIDSPGTFVLKGDSEQTGFLGFWARLTHSGSLLPWWSAGSPACKTRSCATPSWRCLMCLGSVLFNFLFCYCGCILNLFAWFCLASFGASQKICIPDGVMCGNGLLYSVHKRSPPILTLRPSSWTSPTCPHLPLLHFLSGWHSGQ